jgi:ATP-dependent helicase/nuclease subunit A
MLIDASQRQQATSPLQSFIVQAPAGSGKTEILTQRYLRLLNHVNAPEQIIALTFTRKAANEMRERILHSLRDAANNTPTLSAHQATTRSYANDALVQSEALNWQLLHQPSRLRIMTIDALCQTLSNAIQLTDNYTTNVNISDKPQYLYREAAKACIAYLQTEKTFHKTLKILLHHLDNRQDQLLHLMCQLLSKRDQWLNLIYQARNYTQDDFEQALEIIIQHELTRFKNCLPNEITKDLIKLTQRIANIESNPKSSRSYLQNWNSIHEIDNNIASGLAEFILTTSNTIRKAFDHHVGLRKGSCSDQEYSELKNASKELLQKLTELPDFTDALLRIKQLPTPKYDLAQWDVLQALLTVLPLLTAHLQLIFNQQQKVDFLDVAQNAVKSLGDDQEPTDLALYLDHKIQHLLIDEFQDTSLQQFQLITKLVQGWEINDGRTLFVVGDPMQSIYRFRAAEVGLFLKAKAHGIGSVTLTPLELRCNFRSTPQIVNWINQQFKTIFPAHDDLESGAISYLKAHTPEQKICENTAIFAYQCGSKEQEAQEIICKIMEELSHNPNDQIAILVRSRNQLATIVNLLKQHHIPFQGVDIDLLANLPHVRDVWALTQALLLPADRLAWLTFLRSPWCGLTLEDLHIIANIDKKQSIYYALTQISKLENLSNDGKTRINWIYSVLHNALAERQQYSLVDWIIKTLNILHMNSILDQEQQNDLEQYWLLLDKFDHAGQIEDLTLFKQELNQLYSKKVVPAQLQIMTIHKSKGLEFDTVILPGIGSRSTIHDPELLRWLHLPSEQYGELLLMSPIKNSQDTHDPLYKYLEKIDAEKNHYEQQRLLYVAATRAKKRLYLFDHHTNMRQGTFRALLKNQPLIDLSNLNETTSESPNLASKLYRLPIEYYQSAQPIKKINYNSEISMHNDPFAKWFGVMLHELLQWICTNHPANAQEIPWQLLTHKMQSLGLNNTQQQNLLNTAQQQITTLFNSEIGQWIIQQHPCEKNEYEWLTFENNEIITRIIDRTFIADNIRWIIDFKTGTETPEAQKKHQEQVNQYAKLFTDELPIRGGLYYLATGNWIEWCI